MSNTVTAELRQNESSPAPDPREAWAKFLRAACTGCRVGSDRSGK